MRLVSSFALATALVLAGAAATPAAAMKKKAEAEQEGPKATFSDEEKKVLLPLQTAINAKDWEAAKAAMPAAVAGAQGADAKNLLGGLLYKLGEGAKDPAVQAQGLDLMLESGKVAAADLPRYYESQGILASNAKNYPKAEAAFARMVELAPNDASAMISLARTKLLLKKNAEALPILERVISVQEAAGQKPEEIWYKYALQLNVDARNSPQSLALSKKLLAAYPSQENWKTALAVYRNANSFDKSMQIDVLRLMRQAKQLTIPQEYLEFAELLDSAGYPGEAKAVLDEGAAAGKVDYKQPAFAEVQRLTMAHYAGDQAALPAQETKAMAAPNGSLALKVGDAYLGYHEYAKSIALYRAALSKGGVDANVVNTHLGIALAGSGDRAGAEAAFKAVTGPRAELATMWISYLNQAG